MLIVKAVHITEPALFVLFVFWNVRQRKYSGRKSQCSDPPVSDEDITAWNLTVGIAKT